MTAEPNQSEEQAAIERSSSGEVTSAALPVGADDASATNTSDGARGDVAQAGLGESESEFDTSELAESEHCEDDAEDSDANDGDLDSGPVEPLELVVEPDASQLEKRWYILKVQVNREDSIRENLMRKIRMAGLESYFGEVIVPTEEVVEFSKAGKRRIVKKKLYPGYLLAHMAFNDETWFLVRETSGIGDFTGTAGKPAPMSDADVAKILRVVKPDEQATGAVKTAIPFKIADRVRVKEGYFQNFEGEISNIDQAHGRVTVMINIFGRPNPVELDHWQIEAV